ncbi:MAG: hypothetical protein VX641_04985 [Planctomycetota bacterium]|nr:hypothetical protein [Planctomycetota bacterium]
MTTTAVLGLSAGAATADVSDFNTTLTALNGSVFQLDNPFTVNLLADEIVFDENGDNSADFGLSTNLDPLFPVSSEYGGNWTLEFALPNSNTILRPLLEGVELESAEPVDWMLSWSDDEGLSTTSISGSAEYIGGGLKLNIEESIWWEGTRWNQDHYSDFDGGILGSRWGLSIADFDSLTFTYPGGPGNPATLFANVIPAPGVLALMGLGGLAARRRRH